MQSAGARKRRRTEAGLAYDMSLRKSNSQTETPGNLVDPSQSMDAAENLPRYQNNQQAPGLRQSKKLSRLNSQDSCGETRHLSVCRVTKHNEPYS